MLVVIPARTFSGREVGVFGLARSGLSSIAGIKAGGGRVFAWDEREQPRTEAAELGAHVAPFADWPWSRIKTLVLSPGIPLTHPAPHEVVSTARAAGAEVIGDVELFAREIRPDPARPGQAPVIAITGTNGKSTTTALVGHILSSCGFQAEVGGNIGRSALDLALPGARTIYALEISSYQIDLAPGFAPDVAVLTNISPDHIERHGSIENYSAVKSRLLEQAGRGGGTIIVGVDDSRSAGIYSRLAAGRGPHAVPVSVGKVLGRGVFALDGALYDAWDRRAARVMDLSEATRLLGAHNWQNAALAYAAVRSFIKDSRAIASAIATFPGLAHRMEDVGRIGKVRFINDSKATNADAAARALLCYSDIYWIAGGRAKKGGIESLLELTSRVRRAYLVGEAADGLARVLDGHAPHENARTLENAVASAFADASRGPAAAPIVLLSPACASFDQFRDFEERGDRFRFLVSQLAGTAERQVS